MFFSAVVEKGVLREGSLVILQATVFTLFLSLVLAYVRIVFKFVVCVTDYRFGVIAKDLVDVHVISDPFWTCLPAERKQDCCGAFTHGTGDMISWVKHKNSPPRFSSTTSEGGVCR